MVENGVLQSLLYWIENSSDERLLQLACVNLSLLAAFEDAYRSRLISGGILGKLMLFMTRSHSNTELLVSILDTLSNISILGSIFSN